LPCIKSILYEFPHQCGREAVECLCAEELAVNGICLFMLDPRRGAARAGV
jgi:hypothetical protein